MSEREVFLPDILTNGARKMYSCHTGTLFGESNKLHCSTGMEICSMFANLPRNQILHTLLHHFLI